MTPDTCPHCGAPALERRIRRTYYACGSWRPDLGVRVCWQSPECARYVRTRIAHLKRMASLDAIHAALHRASRLPPVQTMEWALAWPWRDKQQTRNHRRMERFRAACLREIDRLRGGA